MVAGVGVFSWGRIPPVPVRRYPLSHPEQYHRDPVETTNLDISFQFIDIMQKNTGLGHIQKTILRKLEKNKYVILSDIRGTLPQSTRRAASSLTERGIIAVWCVPMKKKRAGARLQYYSVATLPDMKEEELSALVCPS